MLWTVIASTDLCKIYQYDSTTRDLQLVKQLVHPESRLKDQDLVSDRPGHYKGQVTNRGAYVQDTDPKEVELEEFARQIARELDLGRTQNKYEKLVLMSQPKMLGLIRASNNSQVNKLIVKAINEDFNRATETEIVDELRNTLRSLYQPRF